jgi:cellulose synthase/poly-beta-1,6-N-acetylglucosamine synthase-like glycosyltransferase
VLAIATWAVAVALLCFSARRVTLLGAALLTPRPAGDHRADVSPATVVTAARNEGAHVEHLLGALDRLDYPPGLLSVVVVDDASGDDTAEVVARWVDDRDWAQLVRLPARAGKSAALNEGIAVAPEGDLIAVCDADLRPRPDWLATVAAAFADETVGMASGRLLPRNADASVVARYAAVESWVHQLVSSAGKDRLDLNPPAHGASVYRREALAAVGGFAEGRRPGEDVQASTALTRAGWRTRFITGATVENTVTEELRDYWEQHVRWARNVWATAAQGRRTGARPPLRRRVDVVLSSLGYADRLVFAAAVALAAGRWITPWLPVAYAGVLTAEVAVAVAKAGSLRRLPGYLACTAIVFPIDVLASTAAGAAHLTRRPRAWRTSSRDQRAKPEGLAIEQGLAGETGGVGAGDRAGGGRDVGDPG